ncbi:MAG: hypothetical protein AAGK32_08625, partial [Actinomycetota bacterium]
VASRRSSAGPSSTSRERRAWSGPRPRPLLLNTYSAIDSYPIAGIGANGGTGRNGGLVIGGDAPQTLTVEGRTMHGAPDWSKKGPPTIFGSQQGDN